MQRGFVLPTRRRLLAAGALAITGLVVDRAGAEPLPPTPACHDGDEPTVRQTEGPYFKASSPERADLVEAGSKGRLVEISGVVLTRSCHPVPKALLDLWHADETGAYDNTRHYHLKVQAPGQSVLTTQLYFPDEPANRRDGLFRPALLMRMAEAGDGLAARFDFVVDAR
jgi:protocatechuate 3,4-dioxygenase beta subunit